MFAAFTRIDSVRCSFNEFSTFCKLLLFTFNSRNSTYFCAITRSLYSCSTVMWFSCIRSSLFISVNYYTLLRHLPLSFTAETNLSSFVSFLSRSKLSSYYALFNWLVSIATASSFIAASLVNILMVVWAAFKSEFNVLFTFLACSYVCSHWDCTFNAVRYAVRAFTNYESVTFTKYNKCLLMDYYYYYYCYNRVEVWSGYS